MKATKPRKFFQQIAKVVFLALLTLSFSVLSQSSYGHGREIEPIAPDTTSRTTGPRSPQCEISDVALDSISESDLALSSPPTFVWWVKNSDSTEVQGEFHLYELTDDGKPGKDIIEPYPLLMKPGPHTYTLHSSVRDLLPHQSYEWRVTVFCDPVRRELEQIWIKTEFTVAEIAKQNSPLPSV